MDMANTSPTRVAIYARVPKGGSEQDQGNELWQLREWCAYERHVIIGVYLDHEGGANGPDRRPELTRLLADASRGQFDMVLVWSVDYFSRKRMGATVADIQRLLQHGVEFHSFTEEHFCTDNEGACSVLLPVIHSLARLERQWHSERTKAGLRRARAKGKRLGREPFGRAKRKALRGALDTGANWHRVSQSTGIPYSSVKKHARALGYEPPGRRYW